MPFSDDLKAARTAAGLTQQEASDRLRRMGISASVRTIGNWENDRRVPVPAARQERILHALRSATIPAIIAQAQTATYRRTKAERVRDGQADPDAPLAQVVEVRREGDVLILTIRVEL